MTASKFTEKSHHLSDDSTVLQFPVPHIETGAPVKSVPHAHSFNLLSFAAALWADWRDRLRFERERARFLTYEPDSVLQDLGISREDLARCHYRKSAARPVRSAEVILLERRPGDQSAPGNAAHATASIKTAPGANPRHRLG